jgi:hypothetical protein
MAAALPAEAFSTGTAAPDQDCRSRHSLVVARAGDWPALLGAPAANITLWSFQGHKLTRIPLQIDHRDEQKNYLLEANTGNSHLQLSANDEIVFRLADAGTERRPDSASDNRDIRAEIQVIPSPGEQSHWVYVEVSTTGNGKAPASNLVKYQEDTDTVSTDHYKAGFSHTRPFLLNSFQWRLKTHQAYSPNVLDSMKIRHTGNMLGLISFKRTSEDYSSRLTRVKTGPLRTIRRTENRVRVLWYLKTPKLYIDYVMMPDSFVMDTIIDIPFNMGLFFDNLETLTTVDWRAGANLPPLKIHSPVAPSELRVTGQMTPDKMKFNTISGTRFSVHSNLGTASVRLKIPEDFPIKSWLYINDDVSAVSPDENQPGQFGNVGYRTTDWENIDTNTHHLKIITCLSDGGSARAP